MFKNISRKTNSQKPLYPLWFSMIHSGSPWFSLVLPCSPWSSEFVSRGVLMKPCGVSMAGLINFYVFCIFYINWYILFLFFMFCWFLGFGGILHREIDNNSLVSCRLVVGKQTFMQIWVFSFLFAAPVSPAKVSSRAWGCLWSLVEWVCKQGVLMEPCWVSSLVGVCARVPCGMSSRALSSEFVSLVFWCPHDHDHDDHHYR